MLEIVVAILAVLALVIVGILLLASRRPDSFHTQRSLTIAAPAERLYGEIAELKAMNTWNPFALRDPASKISYEGPASGVGARHRFDGGKSGTGYVEVTKVEPPKAVTMRLVMVKPFKADNTVEFTLVPAGADQTTVTWAMSGKQPLLAKCMAMFIDCDKMVGREFETGLAGLKAKVEGR
ncbi:MAG: SRPBCC family protein [Hyphomicrobiaceae bacterium]